MQTNNHLKKNQYKPTFTSLHFYNSIPRQNLYDLTKFIASSQVCSLLFYQTTFFETAVDVDGNQNPDNDVLRIHLRKHDTNSQLCFNQCCGATDFRAAPE